GLLFFGGGAIVAVFLTEPSQPYWALIVWSGGISIAIGGGILLYLLIQTLRHPKRVKKIALRKIGAIAIPVLMAVALLWASYKVTPSAPSVARSPKQQDQSQ